MDEARMHHLHISVRGMLASATDRELDGLFTDTETGRSLSALEARHGLMDHLAHGREVIPLGKPCDGFDYSGKGCPGHPIEADR